MAKEKFDRSKTHVNIGTIGHFNKVDQFFIVYHVAFVQEYNDVRYTYLTRINTAHVEYQTANRHYAHVDCPGHADYVKNMITGAAQPFLKCPP